jgi:hypothetical protein
MEEKVVSYKLPKLKISEAEKIWMNSIYTKLRNGEEINTRALRTELWEKLPRKFDPRAIDRRLVLHGSHITLLGVWHIHPGSDLIEKTDRIITAIRDMILKEHKLSTFSAKDLAAITNIPMNEVAMIFENFLSQLGHFIGRATILVEEGRRIGYETIDIESERAFNQFLSYEGIEPLMNEFFRRLEPTPNSELKPVSDVRQNTFKPNTAFIIMWMDAAHPELEDVCNAVKEVCNSFGIHAMRADDVEHQDKITEVVLKHITESEFLIADLTGERPNVYYEVGFAHAINKHPILFRRQDTRLHFDLSVHNVPEYKNVTELKNLLRRRFEAILGRTPKKNHTE